MVSTFKIPSRLPTVAPETMSLRPTSLPHQSPAQILSLTSPPTLSNPAPTSPDPAAYILSITTLLTSPSLLLSHATSNLTVVDKSSFQLVDKWVAPAGSGEISGVVADGGAEGLVWTCGKEGGIIGWDSRVKGGKASSTVMRRTFLRFFLYSHLSTALRLFAFAFGWDFQVSGGKNVPLLSIASAASRRLLATGTELTNHEALIAYW